MFGILKKKLKKAVEAVSEKFKKKDEEVEEAPQKIEEVVKEEPVAVEEAPVVEEPAVEEPVVQEPEVEPVIEEEPIIAPEPVIEEPAEAEPVIEEPVIEEKPEPTPKPAIPEPVVEEVVEKPVVEEPVIEEPTVKEPIAEEPVVVEPEVVEEVTEEAVEEVVEEAPIEEVPVEKVPEIKPEPAIEKPKEVREVKKSIFRKAFDRVVKRVVERRLSEEDIAPILDELVTDLIEADVAVETAEKIKSDLTSSLVGQEIKRGKESEAVVEALRNSLMDILSVPTIDLKNIAAEKKPVTILFLGFNGSGKTTSLAKCANWLMKQGYSCVFAAGDTFRAAAVEQLEEHAGNLKVKVIKHKYGADPAAVVYDAVDHAKAKGINFVMADTAGRMHTNQDLMGEMKKIIRVNKPDLKILVIDSLTGNDAVLQARSFGEVDVDAVIFTKVDVNEKGGAILSVTHELKKPILFLGLGQKYEDMEIFEAEKFISNILG